MTTRERRSLWSLPVNEITTVDGQTYYRTDSRLFVLRKVRDVDAGDWLPVWAFVCWVSELADKSKETPE